MSEFKIDFFELAFLAEACIPPCPIARAMFFADLSDKYYSQMTQEERNKLFEWLTPKLDLSNEDCQHFFARFNIHNQYDVKQPIKYVHQLQNLYFAMTGEELVFSTEP